MSVITLQMDKVKEYLITVGPIGNCDNMRKHGFRLGSFYQGYEYDAENIWIALTKKF